MLIAAAVNENSLDAVVPETLDEAKGIIIFDDEEMQPNIRFVTKNLVDAMTHPWCEALLCGVIHDQALFEQIAEASITRYFAAGLTARDAVVAMNSYQLDIICDYVGGTGCSEHEQDHAEECGGDCSSCCSSCGH